MKWYNVKERLPTKGETVVCYYDFQSTPVIDIMVYQSDKPNYKPLIWRSVYGNDWNFDIQWWCPLSEFPFPN